ncbi:thermolysin family peptidase [Dothidotthia symphoricarpi CBS 119687]|uniref:Thermolysin family peptidase n=1 Tax=Dothidotthia symphoricarpi CBS 119687 TaxID=1392245 RepID=A0A6A6ABJ1_9PLEO|nr:thermolysin family peptidase [Dothidotthia symphoricarpi CBS 119687]KAF2129149.1 thermolysin family peptidase [Dothidotthia symphoricarpi CBS 119687]
MGETQRPVICGFVPPYILEAVARSNVNAEDSDVVAKAASAACNHTLKHITTYHEHRYKSVHGNKGLAKQDNQQAPLTADAAVSKSVQRKIYDCKQTDKLPGKIVRSEGQARIKDRQVNNVYDGFGITHDFYSEVFGRNSLDDKGLPLNGNVHYKAADAPAGYNNAFWDGDALHMVFGDGDDITFDYLTDSLDVIAHELSHGFVQFSSPLNYESQAGALNESCADVFGSMTEQWHMKQTAEEADWKVGQTIFPVAFTGSALRTFQSWKAYTDDPVFGTDPQPKHMKDIYTGSDDNGGVHINSGIPNHAFYLAATAIGGNSWEKAGKVWYKTMMSGKIPVQCDFETFANVTVKVAAEEFPDADVKDKIRDAWVKVGVLT